MLPYRRSLLNAVAHKSLRRHGRRPVIWRRGRWRENARGHAATTGTGGRIGCRSRSAQLLHLLPVMLRNDLPSQRALWLAFPLLGGGFLVAVGVARGAGALVWTGAAMLTCGLAIILAELIILVVRAPRGRLLVASRLGIALACAHVVAAFCIGAIAFDYDGPFAGLSYERWLPSICTLLCSAGSRCSSSPSAGTSYRCSHSRRQRRGDDCPSTNSVSSSRLASAAWARHAQPIPDARRGDRDHRRARPLRGPYPAHGADAPRRTRGAPCACRRRRLLPRRGCCRRHRGRGGSAGGRRLVLAYAVALLVGWAGGIVVGHIGKLLSLSIWVWCRRLARGRGSPPSTSGGSVSSKRGYSQPGLRRSPSASSSPAPGPCAQARSRSRARRSSRSRVQRSVGDGERARESRPGSRLSRL